MHVHFSYQHVSRNPQMDKTIQQHVGKLGRFLTRFSPDLIHLHGMLEFNAAHQGPMCSLNLWLPTAQLHARHEGGTPLAALQTCFNQLLEQVKKHKQVLRREDVWKRRRYKFRQEAQEQAAAEVRLRDRQQLREYLDLVLPQLERFVTRELQYREMAGILQPASAQAGELVNEVVARALENIPGKDSGSAPYHRLLSEAVLVLNGPLGSAAVNLSEAPEPNYPGAGAAQSNNPPQPVDLLLAFLPTLHREAYLLHALEGFSWEETAAVLGNSAQEVEEIFRQVSGKVAALLGKSRSAPESESPLA